MEKQSERFTFGRFPGLVILLFLAAGTLGGQSLDLVLQGDRFKIGDRINFEIQVPEPDPAKVSLAPLVLPPALTLVSGPFIRPGTWRSGEQQTVGTLVSYVVSVKSDGIAELGPFTVRLTDRGEVRTGTRILYLLKPDEAGRRYPLEYSWSVGPGPFYEYQAIPLTYTIGNLGYLPVLKEIPLGVPGNVLLERTSGISDMKVSQLGEESLFQVPYDSWILIPLRSGPVQIPPTAYQVDELKRTTLPLRIDVLPLPAEVKPSRAVGSFSYSAEVRTRSISLGEELVAVMELRGSGNFPTLQLPVPDFPGFTLLSQDELNDFLPSAQGYTGFKRLLLRFSPQRPGPQSVTLPGFVWMMPEGGRIFSQGSKDVTINVSPGASVSRTQEQAPALLGWDRVVSGQPWTWFRNPASWILALPGVLLLGLGILRRTLARGAAAAAVLLFMGSAAEVEVPKVFVQAQEFYLEKRYEESSDLMASLLTDFPENPVLLFNMALNAREAGNVPESLQLLRRSLGSGREIPEAGILLQELEASSGLRDQWSPTPLVDPAAVWMVLMVSVNLVLVGLGVAWGMKKKRLWGLTLAAMAVAIASASLFAGVEAYARDGAGVVASSPSALRRVPGEKGEDWMNLTGGTAVRILGRNSGYALVRTGYGLEGWMSEKDILRTDWSYFSR